MGKNDGLRKSGRDRPRSRHVNVRLKNSAQRGSGYQRHIVIFEGKLGLPKQAKLYRDREVSDQKKLPRTASETRRSF